MCRADSLKVTDFMAVDKYIIPLEIKGMSSRFKFKDYAPLAFRNLRNFWSVGTSMNTCTQYVTLTPTF